MSDTDKDEPKIGDQHGAAQVTQTIEEGQQAAKDAAGGGEQPTPESLGVTQEQFDKYYKAETGYNWQAHAKEMEFKLQKKGEAGEDAGGDKSGEDKSGEQQSEEQMKKTAEEAGLDWDEITASVTETGDLSKEQRAALNKIGIPDDIIDQQLEYRLSTLENHVKAVVEAFGGEKDWEEIHAEAKEKLTQEERQEIDRLLNDPNKFRLGVDLALQRLGRPPVSRGRVVDTPNANGGGNADVKPFADQSELNAAISDPRYRANTKEGIEYRNEVYARARASNYANNPRAHTSGL